jgi:hypothetical protein
MRFYFLFFFINTISFLATGQEQKAGGNFETNDTIQTILSNNTTVLRFLSFERTGFKNQRHRFYEGQYFEFKLKDDVRMNKLPLQKINEKSILIKDVEIPLSEIDYVKIDQRKVFPNIMKSVFMYGAIGYFTLDMVNNNFNPIRQTFTIPAFMLGANLVMRVLYPNKRIFKLNKNKYLMTIIIY